MPKVNGFTGKQQAFIDAYLRCFNATDAAVVAGYSPKTATVIGCENLSKPNIRAEIDRRIKERSMSADEVLTRLADIARGDIAGLMEVSGMGFSMDMQTAKDKGLTKLIKRVKQKTTLYIAKKESEEDREVTELEVELYDAQSALVTIGKQHGLFSTKIELSDLRNKSDSELVDEFTRLIQPEAAAESRSDTGGVAAPPDRESRNADGDGGE